VNECKPLRTGETIGTVVQALGVAGGEMLVSVGEDEEEEEDDNFSFDGHGVAMFRGEEAGEEDGAGEGLLNNALRHKDDDRDVDEIEDNGAEDWEVIYEGEEGRSGSSGDDAVSENHGDGDDDGQEEEEAGAYTRSRQSST